MNDQQTTYIIEQLKSHIDEKLVQSHQSRYKTDSELYDDLKKDLFEELDKRFIEYNKKIDSWITFLNTASNVRKALLFVAVTLTAVTGTLFSLKTILNWLR
jgi:hypothetical protein